jgi:hypothetical protein
MMDREPTCERALDEDRAVRYLQGALPEAEEEAFEVHLLECQACSDLVEGARVARDVLTADRPAARAVRPPAVMRYVPLAAALIVAAGAAFLLVRPPVVISPAASESPGALPSSGAAPDPPPAGTLPAALVAELARVDPPSYLPLTLRGTDAADAAFERAMAHYARGEHAEAAERLRTVVARRPAFAEARFFLGVSELMAGRTKDARVMLAQVAQLDRPPYSGAAVFFGAKADLLLGAVEPARASLRATAAGDGPYAAEARRILERLPPATP